MFKNNAPYVIENGIRIYAKRFNEIVTTKNGYKMMITYERQGSQYQNNYWNILSKVIM